MIRRLFKFNSLIGLSLFFGELCFGQLTYVEPDFSQFNLSGSQYGDDSLELSNAVIMSVSGARLISGEEGEAAIGFGSNTLENRVFEMSLQPSIIRKVEFRWRSYFTSGSGSDREVVMKINGEVVGGFSLEEMDLQEEEILEFELPIEATSISIEGVGSRQYLIESIAFYFGEEVKERPNDKVDLLPVQFDELATAIKMEWETSTEPDRFLIMALEEGEALPLFKDGESADALLVEQEIAYEWLDGSERFYYFEGLSWGTSFDLWVIPVNNYGGEILYGGGSVSGNQKFATPELSDYVSIDFSISGDFGGVGGLDWLLPFEIQDPFRLGESVGLFANGESVSEISLPGESFEIYLVPGDYQFHLELMQDDEVVAVSNILNITAWAFPFLDPLSVWETMANQEKRFSALSLVDEAMDINQVSQAVVESLAFREGIVEELLGTLYADVYELRGFSPEPTLESKESAASWLEWLENADSNPTTREISIGLPFRKGDLWDFVLDLWSLGEIEALTWVQSYYAFMILYPNFGETPEEDIWRASAELAHQMTVGDGDLWNLLDLETLYREWFFKTQRELIPDWERSEDELNPNRFLSDYIESDRFWSNYGWTPFGEPYEGGVSWKHSSLYGDYCMDPSSFPWIWTSGLGWIRIEAWSYLNAWIYSAERGWIPLGFGVSRTN